MMMCPAETIYHPLPDHAMSATPVPDAQLVGGIKNACTPIDDLDMSRGVRGPLGHRFDQLTL
ncbi:hypothetical protein Syun_023423 [Stephania yunnanensis]|uniref:Uncharacterized protein n=1 Tax=Stephania yunnanensis TaxID=152371 RepID=A0AAP0I290_9MAGN